MRSSLGERNIAQTAFDEFINKLILVEVGIGASLFGLAIHPLPRFS